MQQRQLGRLLELVASHSEGGYVLIRYARHKGARHRVSWVVNVRRAGRDWTSESLSLGSALYHAACRLLGQPPG